MAGGKETPRQKMIGMMYLVLTALLALNVSKQILDAFVTIEDKLMINTTNFDRQNQFMYNDLERAMADPDQKKKVQYWHGKAENVRLIADKEYNYIDSVKLALIEMTEGESWVNQDKPWIDEGRKIKNLKPFNKISKKDDYDTPTYLLVGSDAGNPNGEAKALKERFHQFRNQLTSILGSFEKGNKSYSFDPSNPEDFSNVHKDDTSKIKQLWRGLTLPDKIYDDYEKADVHWETKMFDHAPIVAALAMLTSIQADIRNAESQAIEHITGKLDIIEFPINKLSPLAVAQSNYMNTGDSLQLEVFMAGYDTLKAPVGQYIIDSVGDMKAMIQGQGRAIVNLKADNPGQHIASGSITIDTRSGPKSYPWYFPYEVGTPSAVISATEMNVLFQDYPNIIRATASGYPSDKLKVTCSGCSMKKNNKGEYITTVSRQSRDATISISGEDKDGKMKKLGETKFRILAPPPTVSFSGSITSKTEELVEIKYQI